MSAMELVPILILVIPCVLGALFWWSMHGLDKSRSGYKSRKPGRPPRTFGRTQDETTHPDYADKDTPPNRQVQGTTLVDRVERLPCDSVPVPQGKPSPYTMRGGEVALAFRVGNRYYDARKNRVFECIALKGKKARLVAFSLLDSVEWEKEQLAKYPDAGEFHKVRTIGGVETCQRGALRADRQATEKEVADEFDFLKQLKEYKPSGAVQVSVTIGDKTYTSG